MEDVEWEWRDGRGGKKKHKNEAILLIGNNGISINQFSFQQILSYFLFLGQSTEMFKV